MNQIEMQMIDHSVSSDWWKNLMRYFVRINDEVEIRCWKEETLEIQRASSYGIPVNDGLEVSIKGNVTAELLEELQVENPTDKDIYNKMTKFFTINVKNDSYYFVSEHYGTEIYIFGLSNDDISVFQEIISPYINYFSIKITND